MGEYKKMTHKVSTKYYLKIDNSFNLDKKLLKLIK